MLIKILEIKCSPDYIKKKNTENGITKETIHIISLQPISKKRAPKCLTVNECDWHILVGKDKRINSHCLPSLNAVKYHFNEIPLIL